MTALRLVSMLLMLVAGQLLYAPPAAAATSCSAAMSNMTFGAVDATGFAETSASVAITCNSTALSLFGTVYVRLCLNVGEGAQGGGLGILPRRMTNTPPGDALQFQMYTNSGRTLVWGSNFVSGALTPLQVDLSYSAPILGGSGTATRTLYGRIPAQSMAAGTNYRNEFSGVHTNLQYRFDEPILFIGSTWPTSCSTGGDGGGSGAQFPFTATAQVPELCTVLTASDLDFGNNPGTISANRDYTSSINLTCRNRTTWNLGLNNGLNASGAVRRMLGSTGSNYVTYELYRDSGRLQRWGSTVGTDTVPGTSDGTSHGQTVYGRVPATQIVPAGIYNDIITATITY